MNYLTLTEAAQYATDKTGQTVEPSALLRAGVHGVLRLSAPFGFGAMYNATRAENEDFRAGLLTISPAHLFEIETEGCAKIEVANSLDGQTVYFPRMERTREQLRVMVADLDVFITGLSGTKTKPPGASKAVKKVDAKKDKIRAILAKIEAVDPALNRGAMPGLKTDFQELCAKLEHGSFTVSPATFGDYLDDICAFKSGARQTDYYRSIEPKLG